MTEHVLVVTTNYSHTSGGVEGHLSALLPLLVERGIGVTIVHLGEHLPEHEEGRMAVWSLPRRLDFRQIIALPGPIALARLVVRLLRQQRGPDPVTVVSTHTRFFPMSLLGVMLARLLRLPVIHTEHGGGHVATASPVVDRVSRWVDLTMGRAVLRGADRVLAVSRDTQRFVRDLAGVDAELFHNGVDIDEWMESDDGGDARQRRLVFVGRLVPEKGWEAFLRVVEECEARGWRGESVLCGDGPDMERLRQAVKGSTGLRVAGKVPPAVVRDCFHGGVYVNPTTAAEGFQLTLIEAAAAGASIVTYDVGGTDEIGSLPGLDVVVLLKGDEDGLIESAWSALNRPSPRPDPQVLRSWDWASVADAYAAIVRSV